jgi:hypothetical protein
LNKNHDVLCWIQIQNHKSDNFSYCSSILASIRKRTKNLINVMLGTENKAYCLSEIKKPHIAFSSKTLNLTAIVCESLESGILLCSAFHGEAHNYFSNPYHRKFNY